jgi:hypothetical protein
MMEYGLGAIYDFLPLAYAWFLYKHFVDGSCILVAYTLP